MTPPQYITPVDLAAGISTDTYVQRISLAEKGGYIWIDEQREILMSLPMFTDMLHALYNAWGNEASAIIFDIGKRSGMRWATNDRGKATITGPSTVEDAFYYLAQLCGLVGYGELRLPSKVLEKNQSHEIELHLHNSVEVDAHLKGDFPQGRCCWLTTGFVSGYMSTFFSMPATFEEVFCRSEGHSFCKIIGHIPTLANKKLSRPLVADASYSSRSNVLTTLASLDSDNNYDRVAIVGHDKGLKGVYKRLKMVAPTTASVLIHGESGVGKEMFARELHRLSGRSGDFVAINGGALPDSLVESELFGVERGAFSGADRSRLGRFERADGGTLFLDEVASLSLAAQVKLLRAIQEGEIERLGGTRPTKVNVRIVCASNVDLREAVDAGQFRQDLYFRLSTLTLLIPPLRERRQDIPLLVNYYLSYYSDKYSKDAPKITDELYQALLNYSYPGNVRELASIVESAIILTGENDALEISTVAPTYPGLVECSISLKGGRPKSYKTGTGSKLEETWRTFAYQLVSKGATMRDVESAMVAAALEETNGNITQASRLIGVSRRQLSYWLNK